MDVVELLLPVRSGHTQLGVDTLQALDGEWSTALAEAAGRCGISHVSWYLAVLPSGSYIVAHLRGRDTRHGMSQLLSADDDFSNWLRDALSAIAGAPINGRTVQLLLHSPLALTPDGTNAPVADERNGGMHGQGTTHRVDFSS